MRIRIVAAKWMKCVAISASVLSSVLFPSVAQAQQLWDVAAGEIELTGTLTEVKTGENHLVLLANHFRLSNKGHDIAPPKSKQISVDAQTVIVQNFDANSKIALNELKVGSLVNIVGPDGGAGSKLTARCINVTQIPVKPEAVNPVRAVISAPQIWGKTPAQVDRILGKGKLAYQNRPKWKGDLTDTGYLYKVKGLGDVTVAFTGNKFAGMTINFESPVSWDAALKKVGLSIKGVNAMTAPPYSATSSCIILRGIKETPPSEYAQFYAGRKTLELGFKSLNLK